MFRFWRSFFDSESKSFLYFFSLIFFLRLLFSLSIGLIDDEAYHWSWSKELMLSYYDHPGMIAWIESLTTAVFGDTVLAVRIPSLLCFLGISFFLWRMALEMFGRPAAVFTLLMMMFSPFFGIGGYVSSPEPPFILCWTAAAYVFWKYSQGQWSNKKTWLILGVIMGLGLNSKFIMALLAPGFGLYMLLDKEKRKDFLTPWPWMGVLIASAICLPIFLWNIEYDWPGFKYQFHERHTGSEWSLSRWSQFFAAQWIFFTPPVFLLMIWAFVECCRKQSESNKFKLLMCLTLPSFILFYPQPFFAEYKPHWNGPAYLLLVGATGFVWWNSQYRKVWTFLIVSFLLPLQIFFYSGFAYPWMPSFYRWMNPGSNWETTYDLSNEFFGWEELGKHLKERRQQILEETNVEVFFAAHRYETTAQTYWGAREKVYQLSTTRSHYTVIQRNTEPDRSPEPGLLSSLLGRDALYITSEKYQIDPREINKWDSCTPEKFEFYRRSELSRTFTIWYCKNFQGITR